MFLISYTFKLVLSIYPALNELAGEPVGYTYKNTCFLNFIVSTFSYLWKLSYRASVYEKPF